MDFRLSELTVEFELAARRRDAERVHVQMNLPLADRVASRLGHLLVRAGTRLETVADHRAAKRTLAFANPDPCGGCAN